MSLSLYTDMKFQAQIQKSLMKKYGTSWRDSTANTLKSLLYTNIKDEDVDYAIGSSVLNMIYKNIVANQNNNMK